MAACQLWDLHLPGLPCARGDKRANGPGKGRK